jgi:hypothetical protein
MSTETIDRTEAERQAKIANERLGKIRDAERFAENKSCVGKTYRYRNSYSCPEKPSDRWWLYAKVQSISKSGHLTVFLFETDKYGHISIQTDKYRYHMNDGYQPIPPAQFDKAWRALRQKISTTKP